MGAIKMNRIKFLAFVVFCLISLASFSQKEAYLFSYFVDNGQDGLHLAYSTDGLKWTPLNDGKSFLTPVVGKDKLMRDPCVLQGKDGLFHMVWTSGWWDRIIGYASSPDLINWSEQKAIPVMEHEPAAKNSWAPELAYDPKKKEYLIFWATTIPGRHSDVSDSEREKGLNHRMYCTRTKDFKTFSPTEMFFNPDFSVIDATIFPKGKKFYMFLKNENPNPPQKNIRVTMADHASGPYPVKVSEPITGKYWAEGPTALQVGDYVYVYFDKYTEHKYGAVRSKNMVDWEDVSDQVSFPKGLRHGTAFTVSKKLISALLKTD
ncbi:MAG: glycoside hydrolase family 43 protein [Prolixibacteraceae bacterium]|nr:glycoside hydrolase family 43 protein [Prolixibacteraceae bacterium]